VQITRVPPCSINTLPSAVAIKSGVIFNGRIWSGLRPSLLCLVAIATYGYLEFVDGSGVAA
jgi:hypothetical protein